MSLTIMSQEEIQKEWEQDPYCSICICPIDTVEEAYPIPGPYANAIVCVDCKNTGNLCWANYEDDFYDHED